ncbi:mannosyl-3-phosphoglycerate phosphatase-related protein [Sodalis ligni]|uniref:Mannosyl-3-phosphoglycerate phosphatase n=1 Tax=Sodalis ligni TaxID=2697027 RepID=A0A4V2Q2B6_9GAMM|nr:mannosyl-3-phosphoglycerate phosphatase-related protein [Sodalis ligni]TCL02228.1 mannosyl-3-phosphoglycerate phosphatase [Sodalis ligni]
MPSLQDPLLVVTDLDGSLLDHHTYSWQAAAGWLEKLKAHRIPVVICSSKTSAEIKTLQTGMGLEGAPFIAENGALLHAGALGQGQQPDEPVTTLLGQDYAAIREALETLRRSHGFKFFGFGDVNEQLIGEWTGLAPHDALLAQQRQASEALIWRDSDERMTEFVQELEARSLALIQGGRFYHVLSKGSNKGAAVRWLLSLFRRNDGRPWQSLGLGDGPNDVLMLQAVDYAVIIRGYSKTPLDLGPSQKNVYRTAAYGPEGWTEGLEHFITSDGLE